MVESRLRRVLLPPIAASGGSAVNHNDEEVEFAYCNVYCRTSDHLIRFESRSSTFIVVLKEKTDRRLT